MAKERLKSPRARLFVALDLPDPVRAGLELWQARELEDEALRPVRPDALHVTLCFLSYHPERLSTARLYQPEKREFWTHVTVARVRSERGSRARGGRGKPLRVGALPAALPAELTEPFKTPRLALYRSYLRPSGAEYVRLAELNLTLAEER
jgi:2'-5' RNA ligase